MSPCSKPYEPYKEQEAFKGIYKARSFLERETLRLREVSRTLTLCKTATFSWKEELGEKRPQW